ncbi:MAG TPA: CapA family protein [Gaiellaceae bacterium]|nr:CapA family protein [Gaiellaceae bacterium]
MRTRLLLAAAVALGAAGSARAGTLPRVDSTLPPWLAPGGVATVSGWAAPATRVALLTGGGATLAHATSGAAGRFALRFRAPASGDYRLRVAAGGATAAAGRLHVRPLRLAAVGDITFGEQVGPALATHGAAYPWTGVAAALRSADLTVGNLETSVSTRGAPQAKQYVFRGPPWALPPLARLAGFDVLTLANNHSGDYGPGALLDTLRAVRAAGIVPVGAGVDAARAARPALLRAGGLRVAVFGWSDVNPLGFPAGARTPGTARADAAAIESAVRSVRRRVDLAVCFFHWGVERRAAPNADQERLAAACLDGGAQVVLGAHPHVLGRVAETRPHRLVAWTLGNFVFPSSGIAARTGILDVRLGRAGVLGWRLRPVEIDGFRPRLAGR